MIQRVQSIWLLLASACSMLSLKLPFYVGTNKTGVASYELLADADHFLLLSITIVVAVLSLISIFLYRNRTLQLRIVALGMLVQAVLLFLFYRETTSFQTGTYALTSLLQPAVIVFLFLAIKGITKDNKIIKDSDRLR